MVLSLSLILLEKLIEKEHYTEVRKKRYASAKLWSGEERFLLPALRVLRIFSMRFFASSYPFVSSGVEILFVLLGGGLPHAKCLCSTFIVPARRFVRGDEMEVCFLFLLPSQASALKFVPVLTRGKGGAPT